MENNILSDIRSFHMNMLEGGFDNDTADDNSVDIPAQARSLIRSSHLPLMLTGYRTFICILAKTVVKRMHHFLCLLLLIEICILSNLLC